MSHKFEAEIALLDHPQTLAAHGVLQDHPAIMRYECFRKQYPPEARTPRLQDLRRLLAARSSEARSRMSAAMANYYEIRRVYVANGWDPESVARPTTRTTAADQLRAETPDERRQRLTDNPAPHWLDLPYAKPPHVGEGEAAAHERDWRRQMRRDYYDSKRWRTEAGKQAEKAKLAQLRAARAAGVDLSVAVPAAAQPTTTLAMRGAERAQMPWAARVIADIATIIELGRPLPRAERHAAAHLPLWERTHREKL